MELAEAARSGTLELPNPQPLVNMHCHTFYSYNAYGHSPTSLAWLARTMGLTAAGIVDFDVLDAVEEFLVACDVSGMRGSAGIETRVFIPEFATREINSPGEPGVCYHMGIGFTVGQAPPGVAPVLVTMRARAERRNREMVSRVNAHLDPIRVDYDLDVLPLTPAGNATERHLLAAYLAAAERAFPADSERATYWATWLGVPLEQLTPALNDYAKLANLVRARLMKRGGVGYVQPSPDSFPTVEEFHALIVACGALPCAAWLDGTTEGELAIEELLDLLESKGVVALNIIPDRNWNIADLEARRAKVAKLYEVVEIAGRRGLPLNVGTEMNSPGNRLVDDFDAPELAPLAETFLAGAHFIYGHTALQRALGCGYQSSWANSHLPERRRRNEFYRRLGELLPPGRRGLYRLAAMGAEVEPDQVLRTLATD